MTKALKGLDSVEEAVRSRLEAILGVDVVQLDFGAGTSVPGLEIRYPDREAAPVEVTQALDQQELETSQSKGMEPWSSDRCICSVGPARLSDGRSRG